ncbi:MAG TPA: sterol desaturase family protein [Chitinophagaceae bacterium]|jgi:sterol desaturase/sphingolipid hydroxylase (fatty acid hydroxylase superfamily)|nr:sterol desaturase family protein [Chitinophagaceae bacterium]
MKTSFTTFVILLLVVLFIVEVIHSYKEDKHLYKKRDTLSNLAVGVGYFVCHMLSKGLQLFIFQCVSKLSLFHISELWYVWVLSILAADLSYYWFHRASHEIEWLWAVHVVHHSSEQYNLSIAFRVPWAKNFTGGVLFWIWMPLIGFSPMMTFLSIEVCLLYQVFLHTETVRTLPSFIENIFNTPSHHRVHHSSNLKYLDRNHGAILIIWDKLFSTFQKEEEKPVYGLTKKLESYNPITITFHEWITMFKKMVHSGSFRNAVNYLIQPPGWSHDGSTKTVRQLKKEIAEHKALRKKCDRNCATCPLKQRKLMLLNN